MLFSKVTERTVVLCLQTVSFAQVSPRRKLELVEVRVSLCENAERAPLVLAGAVRDGLAVTEVDRNCLNQKPWTPESV